MLVGCGTEHAWIHWDLTFIQTNLVEQIHYCLAKSLSMFALNSRFLSFNSWFKLKCWKKLWFEDLFRTLFVRIFKNRLVCLSTQHQGPSFQITNSAPSPNTEFHIIKNLSYFLVHVSKSTSIYQHRCTKRNPSITFFISTSILSLKILNIIQPSNFVLFFVLPKSPSNFNPDTNNKT